MRIFEKRLLRLFISSIVFAGLVSNESRASDNLKKEEAEDPGVAIGVTGDALIALENDESLEVKKFIFPPFYKEESKKHELKLFFPFYFDRETKGDGGSRSLGVLPFYWRHRSPELKTDIVFPLYSRVIGEDYRTDIVLQTYYNRSSHGYNFGFAPLIFLGKDTRDSSSYQVVPPLFWRFSKGDSAFTLAGIFYNRRSGEDYDLGLPPLFFAGKERYKSYMVVLPPLFWRFKDDIKYTTKNIFPPFFYNTREHGWSFGAMPLLYLARDKDWDKTLVIPFYYGSRWQSLDKQGESLGEGRTYVFPLLLSYYKHAPGLSQGGAAFLYQWYWNRGAYMKMFSPLVWMYGNDRRQDDSLLIPPLFYRRKSPIRSDLMAGLVYWDFHEHHKERTIAVAPLFAHNWNLYNDDWRTWVFPSFDFGGNSNGGFHARFHPIFYYGKEQDKQHLVFAPLLWKFRDKEDDDLVLFPFYWGFKDLVHEDSTRIFFPLWWQFDDPRRKNFARVAFPLYWDVRRGDTKSRLTLGLPVFWRIKDNQKATTGVLNFFVNKGKDKGHPFWTFNIFPVLAFGKPPSPEGAYWSVMSGLVGWRRQGRSKQLKLFWLPIDLSD